MRDLLVDEVLGLENPPRGSEIAGGLPGAGGEELCGRQLVVMPSRRQNEEGADRPELDQHSGLDEVLKGRGIGGPLERSPQDLGPDTTDQRVDLKPQMLQQQLPGLVA